jgi:para-nitrobenzyl esterase
VGAFGFLNLEDFGADFAGSVNLGIQDQVLGLKWIKENIAHFGGNPDNITIMGESAGSVSVSMLMTLPQARGLFHKAIAESGVAVNLRTKEQSAREARVLMEVAGVRDAAGLRALPVADILKAVKRAQISFVPVQDGTIIPIDPLSAIGAGSASGIPLLTGTNEDEFRYWIMLSAGLKTATMEQMVEGFPYFKIDLGQNKRTIMEHYTRTLEDPTSNNIGFALIKDLLFLAPQLDLADRQSQHADVWMYRFDWQSQTHDYLGACHAIELPFVFRNFSSPTSRELVGPHPPMGLSDAMMDAWIAFARTGNPNHEGLAGWPVYKLDYRPTMIFNEKSHVLNDPDRSTWFLYENIAPKQAYR